MSHDNDDDSRNEILDPRVQRTRSEALSSAERIFLGEGSAQLTHARVWEASGISRTTLYRHWPTRDDLFADTASRIVRHKLSSGNPKFVLDDEFQHVWCALVEASIHSERVARTRHDLAKEVLAMLQPHRQFHDALSASSERWGPDFFRTLLKFERDSTAPDADSSAPKTKNNRNGNDTK